MLIVPELYYESSSKDVKFDSGSDSTLSKYRMCSLALKLDSLWFKGYHTGSRLSNFDAQPSAKSCEFYHWN